MTGVRPRRRLWKRLRWTAGILFVLLVGGRIALPYLLPSLLQSATPGVSWSWENSRLSLSGGSIELKRIVAAPAGIENADPIAKIEYLQLDIDLLALLGGDFVIQRVELDGADLEVVRDEEGAWNLAAFTAGDDESDEEEEPEEEEIDDPNRPFDPTPGLSLLAGRLQHVRVHVEDRLESPPVETWIDLSLRISDLGDRDRDCRTSLIVTGSHIDVLRLDADWNEGERSLAGRAELALAGLRTEGLEPWLEELDIRTTPETEVAARMRAQLDVAPTAEGPGTSAGSFAVFDTQLQVDDTVVLGLDELRVEASGLVGSGGRIDRTTMTGLRADFGAAVDGAMQIGSISLVETAGDHTAEEPEAVPEEEPQGGTEPSTWELGLVAVNDCLIRYTDRSLLDAPVLGFRLDEASVDDLSAEGGTDLRLTAAVPGSIERISIGGSLIPRAESPECGLDVALDGVHLESLAPWLDRIGCECQMKGGRFRSHLALAVRQDDSGTIRARALLRDVSLTDGDTPLLQLDRIAAEQVVISDIETRLGLVDVDGLRMTAERDPDGRTLALGLAFGEPVDSTRAPTGTDTNEAGSPAEEQPRRPESSGGRFAIGKAQLKDTQIAFVDRSVEPPVEIGPSRFEFSLQDLEIGGPGAAGSWSLRVTQGALFDEFVATGRVVDDERSLRADAEWTGVGLDLARIQGYLEPAGLSPELRAGSFRGQVLVTAEGPREERQTDVEISGVELVDRGTGEPRRLFALPSARLQGLRDDGVARISVQGLRLALDENPDGELGLLGLRMKPTSSESEAASEGDSPEPTPEEVSEATTADSSPFAIDDLQVEDVEFRLVRPAERGPTLTARLKAQATELVDGVPRTATAELSVPECLESIELSARRGAGPEDLTATLRANGFGSKISSLLPDGIELADDSIALGLQLTRETGENGESKLEIRDLALTGNGSEVLFAADRLTLVETPQDDAPTRLSAELDGLVGSITQEQDAMRIAGFRFSSPPESEPRATEAPGDTEPETAKTAPIAPVAVDLQSLRIELSALRYLDASAGDARPLTLSGSLRTTGPVRIGEFRAENDLESEQPARKSGLELDLAADPLLGRLTATLVFDLQTSDPHAEMRLEATGIDGRELAEVLPSFAASLDATAIEDGRIDAELIVDLHAPKRDDGLPDLSHGFGIDVELRDLTVRPDSTAAPELALDRFEVSVDRVLPDGSARIDLIEASGLLARLRQEPEGLRIAGVTLLEPKTDELETPIEQAPAETTQPEAGPDQAPIPGASNEGPVIGIERVLLQNVDIAWTDATTEEELTLPLEDVDIEVQGIRIPAGPRPVDFSAYLRSGDAMLPMPASQGTAIGGLLSATRSLVNGTPEEVAKDPRPVFEEFSANGSLRLDGPSPRGNLRVDLGRLELLALQPFARPSEIDIRAGEFDTRATLDFRGSNGIDVDAQLVFRDLVVNDRGDKLSSALALSLPLESTLYLLRNQRGEQVIPLKFRIDGEGGMGGGALTRTITSALAGVIGEAIAASPLRVTGVLTDRLGLTGNGTEEPLPPEVLRFLGGSIDWEADTDPALGRALAFVTGDKERRLVLQHKLGAADLELAEKLANPEADEIRAIVSRLRQRREELRVERRTEAVEARSLFGSGRLAEAQAASRRVRALDREIGQAEAALDELLALLRPGADRRRARRTRDAAAALGRGRLERIRDELIARGGAGARDRIELRGTRGQVSEDLPDGGRVVIQLLRRQGR